jgi:hypothetical protein
MELNPWVFVLIAYGITAVIAACVAVIVKLIAFLVQRKKVAPDGGAKPGTEGGNS